MEDRRGLFGRMWDDFIEMLTGGIDTQRDSGINESIRNHDVILVSGTRLTDVDRIIRKVEKRIGYVGRVIKCTTRVPGVRKDGSSEHNGEDYFFVSEECFKDMMDGGRFLDFVEEEDGSYGVPEAHMEYLRLMGKCYLLIAIDADGALELKKLYRYITTVFVMPSEFEAVKDEDSTDDIADAMQAVESFDHVVMDNEPDMAADELADIIIRKFGRIQRSFAVRRVREKYKRKYDEE